MRTITRICGPALAALVLAACGSGGGDDADGVASLGSGDETTTTDGDSGGGGGGRTGDDAEFQDAMLEYAQCMRDEGIDFPDPEFSGEGGAFSVMGPSDGGPPTEADEAEMEAADEACRPILEDVRDSMPQPSPEEQAEMQDEMLAFAECMREQGIDWPDPVFDDDEGGLRVRVGSGEGNDGGPDPRDPDVQDAMEECGAEDGGVIVRGGPAGAGGSSEDG